jgi:enterochelin esterase-like enzyme
MYDSVMRAPGRFWLLGFPVLVFLATTAASLFAFKENGAQPEPAVEAVSSSRVEERLIWSNALGREMAFNVYLPPGYDSAGQQHFPVVYMLHGMNGNEDTWLACGLLETADGLIAAGEIQPLIIVTPRGENGYWMDQANGGPRYGTYVVRDLVGMVDRDYRTLAQRASRAIGGMSMGGHGALQLAMNSPETFSVIGAHSVSLRRWEQGFSFFGDRAYFRTKDPVQLFEDNESRAQRFDIWIDIGRSDRWFEAAQAFHSELLTEGIAHEWHAWDGGHDTAYWAAHVADYLRFYSLSLVGSSNTATMGLY